MRERGARCKSVQECIQGYQNGEREDGIEKEGHRCWEALIPTQRCEDPIVIERNQQEPEPNNPPTDMSVGCRRKGNRASQHRGFSISSRIFQWDAEEKGTERRSIEGFQSRHRDTSNFKRQFPIFYTITLLYLRSEPDSTSFFLEKLKKTCYNKSQILQAQGNCFSEMNAIKEAHYNLGIAYLEAGQYNSAIPEFEARYKIGREFHCSTLRALSCLSRTGRTRDGDSRGHNGVGT